MRAFLVVLLVALLAGSTAAVAASGPAPNSGDGISDGSGFDVPPGPSDNGVGDPFGPAPNSGDGISDGSGMDAPNGPSA